MVRSGSVTHDDHEQLRALNVAIGEAETRGDSNFFDELLAPAFAIRRFDGKRIDDREQFISAVAKSAARTTEVESVTLFESDRALVVCVVTLADPGGAKRFHNLRLFTRQSSDSPWKLLAWANEALGPAR